ncbi:MAG: class I SAM-dependent methyltransferase [Flavobacteriales bacterium]
MTGADIIGTACKDYFDTGREGKITVNSSIPEKSFIPVPYLFRSRSEMPELEKMALEFCRGKVLEIGGGVGSHALELQKNGVDVTLLDSSALCCEIAMQRGIRKVINEKLENFSQQGFDTLLLLMNGIGVSGTLGGLESFLDKAKTMLHPGGQILFDSCDILYMFTHPDGSVDIDLNAGYYGEVEYVMSYKKLKGNPFSWLFIAEEVMENIALQKGYAFEILLREEDGMYLARLSL